MKIIATTLVFEGTPECVTEERRWYHPDMLIGHCIEGIGHHRKAPRDPRMPWTRATGYGEPCYDYSKLSEEEIVKNVSAIPAWSPGDFRMLCGGRMVSLNTQLAAKISASSGNSNGSPYTNLSPYTGFHFHNFFSSMFGVVRHKYSTYSESDPNSSGFLL